MSTRQSPEQSSASVLAQRVMEFEALADMDPLQGRLLLGVLQTHHTGDLRVPQAARGLRLEALKPLLRPEGSSEPPTPGPAAGNRPSLHPGGWACQADP